jgi:hypothetical protein
MTTEGEISIIMTTDERSTMMDEPVVEGLILSAAARAELESAMPNPGGLLPAWRITCSLHVARELLAWAEAGEARWRSINPAKAALFHAAVRQVRFGLWRVGAGPPP